MEKRARTEAEKMAEDSEDDHIRCAEEDEEFEEDEDEEEEPYKVGKPQSETPEAGETEFVPPPPVECHPETPPPPPEPAHEDIHLLDQAYYTDMYARINHYREEMGRRTHISVTSEPPEPVVLPKFPEGVLSPIRGDITDTYGKVFWNPVLIPSNSDSEEDPFEDKA